jgi:FkbM family methyltransferase
MLPKVMGERDSGLWKLLRKAARGIPRGMEVRVLRGPLRGKRWVVGASSNACWTGSYEPESLRRFAEAVAPGDTVYDIGANVGIYTLLASVKAGAAGRVYAFEPLPRNLEYLRRHVERNGATNCEIFAAAVADREGVQRFAAAEWEASMARLAADGGIEVPVLTVDGCVYGEKALHSPKVIKIDVEGAEREVLAGAGRAIAEFHPKMFVEVHGTSHHADCRAFLAAHGYQVQEEYGRIVGT